jgi:hypothetical protein
VAEPLTAAPIGTPIGVTGKVAAMRRTIDVHAALITDDIRARGVLPWPATTQSGKLVDEQGVLMALKPRTGDDTLTIEDVDQAMRPCGRTG